MNLRIIPTIVAFVAGLSSQFCWAGPGNLQVVNGTGTPIEVFFMAPQSDWVRVPIPLGGQRTVEFQTPGPSYVVVRSHGTDYPLGWRELYQAAQRYPNAELRLDAKTVNETGTSTYTVTSPVWETRSREVIRNQWFWQNGQWFLMPVRMIENYKVCKSVPEQRAHSFTITKLVDFAVGVGSDGMFEPVRDVSGDVRAAVIESRLNQAIPDRIRQLVAQDDLGDEGCREVNEYLAQSRLFCNVTFKTRQPGADIYARLRSEQREEPIGVSNVTKEQMPAGYYWVWGVRNGSATTRQLVDVLSETQNVFIPE